MGWVVDFFVIASELTYKHGDYEILPYIYSKVDNSTRLISTVIGERVDDVTNIRACDCGAFIFVVPGVDRS
jgi:hypothetical protein